MCGIWGWPSAASRLNSILAGMDSCDRLFLHYSARKLRQLTGRIEDCLGRLTEEQIWARGAETENAVGNLVLCLCWPLRLRQDLVPRSRNSVAWPICSPTTRLRNSDLESRWRFRATNRSNTRCHSVHRE